MRDDPRDNTRDDGPRYTRLRATISEQENFFCVHVQLSDDEGNVASGEEIADTIESASDMIATVAVRFGIDTVGIEVELDTCGSGTRLRPTVH